MRRRTPVTPGGLRKYDGEPAALAAALAWAVPGESDLWHKQSRYHVRSTMPLVARALDRLADEGIPDGRGRHRAGRERPVTGATLRGGGFSYVLDADGIHWL